MNKNVFLVRRPGACAIISLVVMVVCLFGCQSGEQPHPAPVPETSAERTLVKKADNLQKIDLDDVPDVFAWSAQQKTKLRFTGNLPSGAYKFDHSQVEIKDHVIEITPWAQYDPDVMAIQMLIPFADSVEVGPLAAGEYEIRFNLRSGIQSARLEVK